MSLYFGQSKYLTQLCPNGHYLLVLTGECEHKCKPKKKVIKNDKKQHGKSNSPNKWYDYQ